MEQKTIFERKFNIDEWLWPFIVALYVFMRWYKVEPLLRLTMFFGIFLLFFVIAFYIKNSTRKFNYPIIMVMLMYIDYYGGLLYSPYILGQKAFSIIFIFCLFISIYYSYKPLLARNTLHLIYIFGAFSCFGVIIQFFIPGVINSFNSYLLQPEAYKNLLVTIKNGYVTGINGYAYMTGIFSLIFFASHMIKLLLSYTRSQRVRIFDLIMILLGVVAVIMTQKRSMLVCLISASFVVLYLLLRNKPQLFGKIVFIFIIFIIIIFIVLNNTTFGVNLIMRFTEPEDISSGRFDLYDTIYNSFKDKIIFGHGTSSFNEIYIYGAHNVYLQLLYDNGIVGILIWITLFLRVLLRAFKRVRNNPNGFYEYFNVYIQIVFLTYAFFGNPIYNTALILLYFVVVGYTFSEPIKQEI